MEEHSVLVEREAISLGEWFSTLRSIVVTSSSTTKQSAAWRFNLKAMQHFETSRTTHQMPQP